MSTAIKYANSVVTPTGGVNSILGQGMDYRFTLAFPIQNWRLTGAAPPSVTLQLTDNNTGLQTQVGAGDATGQIPTYLSVFREKVYALSGPDALFSEVDDPEVWNDPNTPGNSFITTTNTYSTPESLAAMAPYQGNLMFVARRTVQIWHVDPDPANYAPVQTLPNVGTVAPLSVQPVGDMDVYMLASNGVRSIRVRDASNNALIADVGTPIDTLLKPLLASLSNAQKAAACGAVDPADNRYWVYIPTPSGAPGSIYTFSYFPGAGIAAWGTYSPTYQSVLLAPALNYSGYNVTYTGLTIGQRYAWKPGAHEVSMSDGTNTLTKEGAFVAAATTVTVTGNGAAVSYTGTLSQTIPFVPQKFLVFNDQVWCRAGNFLFQFGGPSNQQYDNCGVQWTSPYVDSGSPGTKKQFNSLDAAFQGTWAIGISVDYNVGKFKTVYYNTQPSFLYQGIPTGGMTGTHYAVQGTESSDGYALFSSALCHQQGAGEKS